MDSNSKIKKGKLYISDNLCIFKDDIVTNISTLFKNIKTGTVKRYNHNENKMIEMFLSNENGITPSDYLSNQFITDLFLLSFSDKSVMIKTRGTYSNTIIYKKKHIDSNIDYEKNKFIIDGSPLLVNKHIIITNIGADKMIPIFRKYNRLFYCL